MSDVVCAAWASPMMSSMSPRPPSTNHQLPVEDDHSNSPKATPGSSGPPSEASPASASAAAPASAAAAAEGREEADAGKMEEGSSISGHGLAHAALALEDGPCSGSPPLSRSLLPLSLLSCSLSKAVEVCCLTEKCSTTYVTGCSTHVMFHT